jgi:hemerythrin-like domain-containing protein
VKRAPQLRQLSDDHHQGLVLARLARHAAAGAGGATPDGAWEEIMRRFGTELDPHFKIEESTLIPALEKVGERVLVERLRTEHAELRALCSGQSGKGMESLRRIGELLDAHIRFEERELFQIAQEKLPAEALEAVRAASEKKP